MRTEKKRKNENRTKSPNDLSGEQGEMDRKPYIPAAVD